MTSTQPYILYFSERSPFARRIRLAFRRIGLAIEERAVNIFEPTQDFLNLNPLGFVPTVVTPSGATWMDSSMILEHLQEAGHAIWPQDLSLREQVRIASTLAEGVMQSAVSYFQEVKLHETPSKEWADDHFESVKRTLTMAETLSLNHWQNDLAVLHQSGLDIAVALEYAQLRLPNLIGSLSLPTLNQVLLTARADPFFIASRPKAS